MTSTSPAPRVARRRGAIALSALAAGVALALGGATSGAWAADWTSGHIDFVSVAANGSSALKLGSNPNDTGWVASSAYTLKVPSTSGASGTGYILPQTESEAASRGVPFAGFSGDEDLRAAGFVAGNTVTIKLDSVSFVPKSGTTGTGTVSISQNGTPWFTGSTKSRGFTVVSGDEEAFHQHAKWVFSLPGTYTLNFSATGNGKTAPLAAFTVKAGV